MRTAMSNETKETGSSFMEKLSTVIVDKRNLIFLLTIILLVFSAFSRNWVEVESDLTYYLPSDSETKQALDIMDEQFTTYGTAEVMVANITPEQAAALEPKIKEIKGVQSVDYDETTAHYNNLSALYSITFAYSEDDEACLDSLEAVKEYLSDYDLYVDTDLGNTQQETIDHEISVIMVYVAIVIVIVLLFTSETYGEVPVLILTFVVALVLNQGTNFLMGKISFISNSVTSILQLALSIDYAIIFCNRFKEEHRLLPLREAVIVSLSKSIPEIGASSLTTIGGLVAMLFMQFKLGPDMALCLIKSILVCAARGVHRDAGPSDALRPADRPHAAPQLRAEDPVRRQARLCHALHHPHRLRGVGRHRLPSLIRLPLCLRLRPHLRPQAE